MDGQKDEKTYYRLTDWLRDIQKDRETYIQHIHTERQRDMHTYRQTDRHTGGKTNILE
jgi:hypothetical protein